MNNDHLPPGVTDEDIDYYYGDPFNHCKRCNKTIDSNETYCDECYEEYKWDHRFPKINIAGKQRSPLLIHYGEYKFIPEKLKPVKNNIALHTKPYQGGLWTSPLDSEFGWKEWNERETSNDYKENKYFIIQLKEDAKIFIIDSYDDLKNAPLINNRILNFEKIAEQYDAIWLTFKGMEETRISMYVDLYSWDCETVLILNSNCFEEMKYKGDSK